MGNQSEKDTGAQVSRRAFLRLSFAGATTIFLAACGDTAPTAPPSPQGPLPIISTSNPDGKSPGASAAAKPSSIAASPSSPSASSSEATARSIAPTQADRSAIPTGGSGGIDNMTLNKDAGRAPSSNLDGSMVSRYADTPIKVNFPSNVWEDGGNGIILRSKKRIQAGNLIVPEAQISFAAELGPQYKDPSEAAQTSVNAVKRITGYKVEGPLPTDPILGHKAVIIKWAEDVLTYQKTFFIDDKTQRVWSLDLRIPSAVSQKQPYIEDYNNIIHHVELR